MNPQYSLFLEGSVSSQTEGRHSRTPSLCSTVSTASSTSIPSSSSDNEDNESVDISFDPITPRQTGRDGDVPMTPLTARPGLSRTISLPSDTSTGAAPITAPFAKFDKLFTSATQSHFHSQSNSTSGSSLLPGDPARAGTRSGPVHRRTVSSFSVGETRRTYKFGGKVFVPLRMDGWGAKQDDQSVSGWTKNDLKQSGQ